MTNVPFSPPVELSIKIQYLKRKKDLKSSSSNDFGITAIKAKTLRLKLNDEIK